MKLDLIINKHLLVWLLMKEATERTGRFVGDEIANLFVKRKYKLSQKHSPLKDF